MGMYTQLHLTVQLNEDVPVEVIKALEGMLSLDYESPPLAHPFFYSTRWRIVMSCGSFYFNADTHSTLRFNEITEQYILNVQSNLKNYDNEIELFLDWIMPYVDAGIGEFIGYYRYEENNEPTLIYKGLT